MLEKLLLFLGIKSWNIENSLVKKTDVNAKFLRSNKNIKSINLLKLLEEDETPSPKMALYKINKHSKPNLFTNCFCILYTIYFLFITCILSIQPIYTLIMFSHDTNKLKYLTSFFLHINLPLIHIWSKIYFKTNHIDNTLKCKTFKGGIIILASVVSMIINLVDIKSFYNEYHWLNTFNDNVLFFTLIVIELL